MSGELYEVLGDCRFVPLPACPAELRGRQIKIRASDGQSFEVDSKVACVAARVKSKILELGADAEIPLPVKRATLAKALEYMEYHSSVPPGDIRTPLVSENLEECGASKWDVNFISNKVDKRLLVELLYASSALDIPTLGLLARTRASTLMSGKSPDEIRKDFNFSNDLPKSEEREIQEMVRALRKRRNLGYDEVVGIAPAAALVGSVWRLAESETAAADQAPGGVAEAGAAGGALVGAASWRQGSWRAAVTEDWQRLAAAPAEVRTDRELLLASLPPSRGKALAFASEELRADRKLVLAAVSCGGESLREAADALRGDRDFVMEAILLDGMALAGAAEVLRGDRDLLAKAADAGRGIALKGASEALRRDADFVADLAERDPEALAGAAEPLREDKAFVMRVVGSARGALRYAPLAFRADRDVVEAAAAVDPSALIYAHASRRADIVASAEVHIGETTAAEHLGPRHAGVPLTVEATQQGYAYSTLKVTKSIVFTALSTITPNMGQSNYIAANAFLDKLAPFQRPEIDSTGLMWGTVGGMGMRWKAFASADFMLNTPDLLMGIDDAAKVLHVVTTKMEMPEWVGANYFDPNMRAALLDSKKGGYRPSEDAYSYPSVRRARPPSDVGDAQAARGEGRGRERSGVERSPGADFGAAFPAGASRSESHRSDAAAAPLGGWPSLAGPQAGEATLAAASAAPLRQRERSSVVDTDSGGSEHGGWELAEGARVQLVGLKNKSGATGTVVRAYPEGRYKVALDDKRGSALLRPEYLQVISPAPPVGCH